MLERDVESARSELTEKHLLNLSFQKERAENAEAEIKRLKRGEFTYDEIMDFCHNLPETVSKEEFAEGCAKYQCKLYGA